jgi:hypothetical protein
VTGSTLHPLFDTANQRLAFGLRRIGTSATKRLSNQSGSRHFGFQFVKVEEDSGSYRNAERLSPSLASEH